MSEIIGYGQIAYMVGMLENCEPNSITEEVVMEAFEEYLRERIADIHDILENRDIWTDKSDIERKIYTCEEIIEKICEVSCRQKISEDSCSSCRRKENE